MSTALQWTPLAADTRATSDAGAHMVVDLATAPEVAAEVAAPRAPLRFRAARVLLAVLLAALVTVVLAGVYDDTANALVAGHLRLVIAAFLAGLLAVVALRAPLGGPGVADARSPRTRTRRRGSRRRSNPRRSLPEPTPPGARARHRTWQHRSPRRRRRGSRRRRCSAGPQPRGHPGRGGPAARSGAPRGRSEGRGAGPPRAAKGPGHDARHARGRRRPARVTWPWPGWRRRWSGSPRTAASSGRCSRRSPQARGRSSSRRRCRSPR